MAKGTKDRIARETFMIGPYKFWLMIDPGSSKWTRFYICSDNEEGEREWTKTGKIEGSPSEARAIARRLAIRLVARKQAKEQGQSGAA